MNAQAGATPTSQKKKINITNIGTSSLIVGQ
jgi:hypothetical protein